MNDLVFLEPNYLKAVPFTKSDVIAEFAEVSHHAIQQTISKNIKDLEEFGKVAFEMRALNQSKTGQSEKIYHLNEPQATLLITYLKNTEPVRKFKKNLVRQFYLIKEELFKRQIERVSMKPVHKELADAVKQIPEHPSSKFDYSKYNNLAYMIVFGKAAKKLKLERGATGKAIAADYLTSDEMQAISKVKDKICVLIEMDMDYSEIKDRLTKIKLRMSA